MNQPRNILPPARQTSPAPSEGLPLSGMRIVELTVAWAGPMAGRVLSYLGAEVIHVEPANNLDSWRSYMPLFLPKRYPDREGGERRYNRAALFNSQNTDKLSFSLDIKAPGGKAVFNDLIASADGLIANFTPGMLDRLGYANEALWALKPDLCIVEMPGFGNSGAMRDWKALGPTMEQAAGMCAIIGYGDGKPVSTGPAYMDPIGGFHGAAAMLTALLHRRRTGEGQYVEVPQIEAAMHLIGEHLLHAAETGDDPIADGNRLPDAAPHDAFRAEGEDEWVVIAVRKEDEWRALCAIPGLEALAQDARFATLEGRIENQGALKAMIEAWTIGRDKHATAGVLQDAGVPAAAVYKANDALTCDYLNARAFSTPLTHPEAGTHPHQGMPYRYEKTPVSHRRAAPCFGEHNHYILRDILKRTDADIADLEQAGTIRSVPDRIFEIRKPRKPSG